MKNVIKQIEGLFDTLTAENASVTGKSEKLSEKLRKAEDTLATIDAKAVDLTKREEKIAKVENVLELEAKVKAGEKELKQKFGELKIQKDAFEKHQVTVKNENEAIRKKMDNTIEAEKAKALKSKAELTKEILKELVNKAK